jgi:DNA-binding transcriptional regulator YhcF (GntR family)
MTAVLGIVSRGRSLSARAQILHMVALDRVEQGDPFPSIPQLAGALGLRERRVADLLAELVAAGEIVKVGRGVWTFSQPPAERV